MWPLVTTSGDHLASEKCYICTSARGMATRLDRKIYSDEKNLSTKSQNTLITWTSQVTWHRKNVISPFPWDQRPPNLTETNNSPNLQVFSIGWSLEVTWQIWDVTFPLTRYIWRLSVAGWWPMRRCHHPQCLHDIIVTWRLRNVISPAP